MLAFHLTTVSHFGIFLFSYTKSLRRGVVWQAICCGAVLSGCMEFAYYCPLVTPHAYEWTAQAMDALSSVVDLYVLYGLLCEADTCGLSGMIALVAVFWHQLVKLQWHWAAEMFRAPTDTDSFLIPLRVWSSWFVLCAYAWVAYSDRSAHRAKEQA